jgi:hypothetical protein
MLCEEPTMTLLAAQNVLETQPRASGCVGCRNDRAQLLLDGTQASSPTGTVGSWR